MSQEVSPGGTLSFPDQHRYGGEVTVEDVTTAQPSTVVVTYNDGVDEVVAGRAPANGLDGEDVWVELEDTGGFPGQHTAWVFGADASPELGVGDTVSSVTAQALDSDRAQVDEPPVVELDNVEIVYDRTFLAVQGVSMEVNHGDIVALLGPNGAGKSTILKMISGIGRSERGEVTRGSVYFGGEDVTNARTTEMVDKNVTHILEGRRVFEDLTVEENLRCGLYRGGRRIRYDKSDYEIAFEYFPQLEDLLDVEAGYTSGGEQQMLVISRALIHRPDLLLLDEPSLGLAPQLVTDIYETLREINREEEITMIIADQNAKRTLEIADYGYVLENGQIELHDPADVLTDREEIKEFYLGTSSEESRYSDIRHYKIRKRWK
jgi:branched-chain amino acid transport system ATP-binding protein